MPSRSCAPQTKPPEQREIMPSPLATTSDPHSGQTSGNSNSEVLLGRWFKSTDTICGITSPALRTTTVSPTRTPNLWISDLLCSVTFETVTPPTKTGSSRATGVIAPVRPTCTSIANTLLVFSCAGNLCAIAQRGALAIKPALCCQSMRFNL